jgi:hypothetical protein
MGRPRKSSEELKASGAKPFKVAKRVAEEQVALGNLPSTEEESSAKHSLSLAAFIARVKKVRETFCDRLDPTKTTCKELGNEEFNWREGHPLTILRTLLH